MPVEKGEPRCLAVLRGRKKAPDQQRPQRRGRSWGRLTWSVPGAARHTWWCGLAIRPRH